MNQPGHIRSTFLTVLCILSFINGGLNILLNIPSLFAPDVPDRYADYSKQLQDADRSKAPPLLASIMDSMSDVMERMSQHYGTMVLSTILLAAMSVIGVWMMWNLRKPGFLFYVTAQVLWTLMPFVFLGTNLLVGMAVLLSAALTLVFIILYGMQLKHMS